MKKLKLLIIGHARHGKDTVAEMLYHNYGYNFKSSSEAAAEIFIYDELKSKYGYETYEECFEDRMNHRQEWHEMICHFNQDDKTRLAREIMKTNDIYVGMRASDEIDACIEAGVFDMIIGVYDKNKELEPKTSFNIDLWDASDLVIPNVGTLDDLERKVKQIFR